MKSNWFALLTRLLCAACFAFLIFGIVVLLDAAGEAFADSFSASPTGSAKWALYAAPIGLTGYFIPILFGLVHWKYCDQRNNDMIFFIFHCVAALMGAVALTCAWVVRWFSVHMNGSRDLDFERMVVNTLVILALLLCLLRRKKIEPTSQPMALDVPTHLRK